MGVQRPAALQPDQVVLADGLHGRDGVASEPLGEPLRGQARLRRLDGDEPPSRQRGAQAQGVPMADLPLGHQPAAPSGGAKTTSSVRSSSTSTNRWASPAETNTTAPGPTGVRRPPASQVARPASTQ